MFAPDRKTSPTPVKIRVLKVGLLTRLASSLSSSNRTDFEREFLDSGRLKVTKAIESEKLANNGTDSIRMLLARFHVVAKKFHNIFSRASGKKNFSDAAFF